MLTIHQAKEFAAEFLEIQPKPTVDQLSRFLLAIASDVMQQTVKEFEEMLTSQAHKKPVSK